MIRSNLCSIMMIAWYKLIITNSPLNTFNPITPDDLILNLNAQLLQRLTYINYPQHLAYLELCRNYLSSLNLLNSPNEKNSLYLMQTIGPQVQTVILNLMTNLIPNQESLISSISNPTLKGAKSQHHMITSRAHEKKKPKKLIKEKTTKNIKGNSNISEADNHKAILNRDSKKIRKASKDKRLPAFKDYLPPMTYCFPNYVQWKMDKKLIKDSISKEAIKEYTEGENTNRYKVSTQREFRRIFTQFPSLKDSLSEFFSEEAIFLIFNRYHYSSNKFTKRKGAKPYNIYCWAINRERFREFFMELLDSDKEKRIDNYYFP